MAIFEAKQWVNPFGKLSIFPLFELLLFIAQQGNFFVLECHKRNFPGLYCLKKKVGKMAIFRAKPWVNPFVKMSIFRLFDLLVFIAQEGVFSFQNIMKDIFLASIAQKKTLQKWPFLDQNNGLTILEKCQFFDSLNFLFLQPSKAFFVLDCHKRHFPGPYCLNRKVGKMAIFGPKPWVNPFRKR